MESYLGAPVLLHRVAEAGQRLWRQVLRAGIERRVRGRALRRVQPGHAVPPDADAGGGRRRDIGGSGPRSPGRGLRRGNTAAAVRCLCGDSRGCGGNFGMWGRVARPIRRALACGAAWCGAAGEERRRGGDGRRSRPQGRGIRSAVGDVACGRWLGLSAGRSLWHAAVGRGDVRRAGSDRTLTRPPPRKRHFVLRRAHTAYVRHGGRWRPLRRRVGAVGRRWSGGGWTLARADARPRWWAAAAACRVHRCAARWEAGPAVEAGGRQAEGKCVGEELGSRWKALWSTGGHWEIRPCFWACFALVGMLPGAWL